MLLLKFNWKSEISSREAVKGGYMKWLGKLVFINTANFKQETAKDVKAILSQFDPENRQ